ncbi:MAG: hypothetical protein A2V70_08235 [Planctomycetes bacterium RBG_13_63_9]|nr:MAG: hypothetical protein A2V70_08235 [Planctomycetes bacterium RBG_13_63_9]
MNAMIKRLRELGDEELRMVSEAIDRELECRQERRDPISESARRRAVERSQSYRRSTGSSAVPVKFAGTPGRPRRRLAA